MVIGRVVLLFFMLLVSGLLLTVERAVGLPVAFFLLLPWGLSLCRQPEQLLLFGMLVIAIAIVFALPVGVAGIFLLAIRMVQPTVSKYVPSTIGAMVKTVFLVGMLVTFALVAKVPISASVLLYTVLVISVASWLGHRRKGQMQGSSADHEKIVVFS